MQWDTPTGQTQTLKNCPVQNKRENLPRLGRGNTKDNIVFLRLYLVNPININPYLEILELRKVWLRGDFFMSVVTYFGWKSLERNRRKKFEMYVYPTSLFCKHIIQFEANDKTQVTSSPADNL